MEVPSQLRDTFDQIKGMIKTKPIGLSPKDGMVAAGLIVGIWFLNYLRKFIAVRRQVSGLHVIHSAIELFEAGHRSKLPHIPYITPIADLTLDDPWAKYARYQSDLFACTQLTTPDYAVYVTSNPSVASSISAKGTVFLKPTKMFRYVAINIFGLQLVSTQTGVEHRRHKNVTKHCFNEAIMETSYTGMVEALGTMIKEEGIEKGGMFEDTRLMMIKLTLLVIGRAGFGMEIPWTIPKTDGKILPFEEALHVVENSLIPQLLVPVWLMEWFPIAGVRYLGKAQRSLLHHFHTMVNTKRTEIELTRALAPAGEKVKPPSDILGAIVASQIDVEDESMLARGDRKAGLSFDEIIANIWIFIVAGHETSGHTLAWTIAHLALYPEWQDAVYKEVTDLCGDNWPSYRDIPHLPMTLAVLYEALRLRDLVMTLPKLVAEDTIIPYTTWTTTPLAGSALIVTHHQKHIKAGSHIIIDSPACSRNPFIWSDPNTYDPTRWLDGHKREGDTGIENFTGFSSGARVCIGKRMAEVEMITVIAVLCKEYRMSPVANEGEGWEEMKKRMMKGSEELNLQPPKFGLKLEKRV